MKISKRITIAFVAGAALLGGLELGERLGVSGVHPAISAAKAQANRPATPAEANRPATPAEVNRPVTPVKVNYSAKRTFGPDNGAFFRP